MMLWFLSQMVASYRLTFKIRQSDASCCESKNLDRFRPNFSFFRSQHLANKKLSTNIEKYSRCHDDAFRSLSQSFVFNWSKPAGVRLAKHAERFSFSLAPPSPDRYPHLKLDLKSSLGECSLLPLTTRETIRPVDILRPGASSSLPFGDNWNFFFPFFSAILFLSSWMETGQQYRQQH